MVFFPYKPSILGYPHRWKASFFPVEIGILGGNPAFFGHIHCSWQDHSERLAPRMRRRGGSLKAFINNTKETIQKQQICTFSLYYVMYTYIHTMYYNVLQCILHVKHMI